MKLEYGDVTYNPKAIYLYNYDGDNILVEMMGKIEEKGLLTNEELSKLIFSILMKSKESF
ncbi:hypothetical protein DET59_12416 [Rossellomorea aquimaris]|uniref:Uncharacterized protein n=1 Tax=Rossellomorea aquimaris TaxID=189382 RepID=A0A366EEH6_9BACI|nr:hypothetical protein DET59_12416 [Rossellomorea aquimaris]